jgi:hypothetical protein
VSTARHRVTMPQQPIIPPPEVILDGRRLDCQSFVGRAGEHVFTLATTVADPKVQAHTTYTSHRGDTQIICTLLTPGRHYITETSVPADSEPSLIDLSRRCLYDHLSRLQTFVMDDLGLGEVQIYVSEATPEMLERVLDSSWAR